MKICLDVSAAVHKRAGLGRYAQELTAALLAIDEANDYISFYNDSTTAQVDAPLDQTHSLAVRTSDKPWRLRIMLAHMARRPQDNLFPVTDVFHAMDHLLPYLKHIPSVFTLCDLTFFTHGQTHAPLNRTFLRLMLPRFLRATDAVIAISECTLHDAVSRFDFIKGKSGVVYLGVSPRFRPLANPSGLAEVRTRLGLPQRFFLYVGTIEPRKNLAMLFEAFKYSHIPDVKLVICGKKGWLSEATLQRLQELGLENEVVLTGFVVDDELPSVYCLAEAFVFPSLYEGFGLPVLEAMACGTAVISSNTSSLAEVADGAALLLRPDDVRGWATAMSEISRNAALRADLRERGLHRAGQFTWESTARQTLDIYRDVYKKRSGFPK
jgi:glycosyltransferase involved in cell wall biosynthesis